MNFLLTRRQLLNRAAPVALALTQPFPSFGSQPWPSRPIHFTSPFPAGGPNDLISRIAGKQLEAYLGQPVVIENRGGAGGTIGTTYVARAPADGYNVLNAASGVLTAAPQIIGTSYAPARDFTPVGFLGHVRFVIAVHPSLGVKSIEDLIAYAKRHPGKINYGTPGNGTPNHIFGEYFKLRTGIDIVHVPYRGSALALQDAVAGHVQLVFEPLATEYIKAGALQGLAYTGASSAPDLPGVPHIDTTSLRDWEVTSFFAAVVRNTTSPAIIAELHQAFLKLARSTQVISALGEMGIDIKPLSLNEINRLIELETSVNNRVIKAAEIPLAGKA